MDVVRLMMQGADGHALSVTGIPPNLLALFSDALAARYTHNQLAGLFRSLGFPDHQGPGSKKDKCLAWLRSAGRDRAPDSDLIVRALGRELLEGGPAAYGSADASITTANAAIADALERYINEMTEESRMADSSAHLGRVFISHASSDAPLVDALADLLQTGIDGLLLKHLFCTSLEGMKIPEGVSFIDFIKGELQNPALVIFVITANYYESAFCLCELGATWAMNHSGFPLLVPPYSYPDLKAVLSTTQARLIDDSMGLNALRDRIVERLGLNHGSTGRWETKRDAFLGSLPGLLAKLPKGTKVPRSELDVANTTIKSLEADLAQRDGEIAKVRTERDAVAALKDASAVAKAIMPAGEEQEFDKLVGLARSVLRDLPRVVRQVILADLRGDGFSVGNRWEDSGIRDDVLDAERNDFVEMDQFGNVSLNKSDPKIKKSIKQLLEVQEFLDHASDHFVEGFEAKHEMRTTVLSERFWKHFFGT